MNKPMLLTLLLNGCLVAVLYAQTDTDSLETRLTQIGGADRIEVLSALATAYQRSDPAQTIAYGREALALLKTFPNAEREVDILYQKGRAHIWLSEYDSASVHAERAEVVARASGYAKGLAEAANLMGTIRGLQGYFDQALIHFLGALATWEEIGDARGLGNALNNIGIVNMRQGKYDEALDYYLRALATWEEIGDKTGIARVLNNTGNVHRDLGNHTEALDFYRRTLAIREEFGDSRGTAMAFNNIGIVNADLGNDDEALDYYLRALSIWEEISDKSNVGRVLNNISDIHADQGNYAEALDFGYRGLAIREEIGDRRGTAIALNTIGMVHRNLGNHTEALDFFLRSLTMAKEVGDQRLVRDLYGSFSGVHEELGDYREALATYKKYKAAHDSLFNAESQSVIAELQTQYQTKEQQQQIDLLQRDRQIQTLWRNVLLGGLLCLVLIALLIYSRYRLKHRAHRTLEIAHAELKTMQTQLIQQEKMASLGQLTAGIAHEIKNPLNFVNNFAEINIEIADELREALAEGEDVSDILNDLKQNAQIINQHGKRADGIVHAMMQHASGGTGRREPTDLNALVSEHIDLAYHGKRAQVPDLNVDIERDFSRDVGTVEMVSQEIGRVLLNLLGNAFDAVHEHAATVNGAYAPAVTVTTRQVDGQVEIRVSDNGPGIPATIRKKIFEPFFTTKPPGSGTGLGLSLSYDIMQGHGGTLTIERETRAQSATDASNGRGATFIITLPHEAPPD